jgi:hypothetical protein
MSFREQLATQAMINRYSFPLFLRWLEHLEGKNQGLENPVELDPEHCITLVRCLTDSQLDDLCWRGLIPTPCRRLGHLAPFPISLTALQLYMRKDVLVVRDQLYEQTIYRLLNQGIQIRLRRGELERLAAADYPSSMDVVLTLLWDHIAPADGSVTLKQKEKRVVAAEQEVVEKATVFALVSKQAPLAVEQARSELLEAVEELLVAQEA